MISQVVATCNKKVVAFGLNTVEIARKKFQPPEGLKQNSPGLQPWEGVPKENSPERAADRQTIIRWVGKTLGQRRAQSRFGRPDSPARQRPI
jgi:hypothetical protein